MHEHFISQDAIRRVCFYEKYSKTVDASKVPMINFGLGTIITTTVTQVERAAGRYDETCLRYCFAHFTPHCNAYAIEMSPFGNNTGKFTALSSR